VKNKVYHGHSIINILLSIIIILLSYSEINAKTTLDNDLHNYSQNGTLRGLVVDSTNGEVLAYCNVIIKELNIGASTDVRGYFRIPSIPEGKNYTLLVSYVGYKSQNIKFIIKPDQIIDIKVELSPLTIELKSVEKTGDRIIEKNATDIGLQRISMKEIENIPQGVETDIFRSLQFIPGVQSTGDVSARYYVRGSPTNENLVLLNGVTLYNPFHAFGLFSVIDPDMINNVEFYKGGFTAEYGGRLSSVLNIVTKDGNKKRLSGSVGASLLSGKALIEGPIHGGSFIISGRKSLNSGILKKFLNNKNAPIDFYDLGGKINYTDPDFIKGGKMTIHGFISHDVLNNNNAQLESLDWTNKMAGIRWFQVTDSPIYFVLALSYSEFSGNVKPNSTSVKPKYNDVKDFSWDMNVNYMFDSKDEIAFGMQLKSIETILSLQNKKGINSDIRSKGANISLFGKYKLLRFDNFGLDFGTRMNVSSLSRSLKNNYKFEPRISLTYVLSSTLSIKGAWGIYSQEMTTLSDDNEIISLFEPWVIVPEYLNTPTAIHYGVGLKDEISKELSIDLQGYYKILHDIPTLNEVKIYPDDHDLISSSGESYGLEALLKYNKGRLGITVSYSLGWAFKTVDTLMYHPRYDTRHNLNLLGTINLGSGWQFSITWIFNSGHPFTQTLGYYEKYYLDDFFDREKYYGDYKSFPILASKNLATLPKYHRLDVSISKKIDLSFIKVSLAGSIINVYNRNNIFYFQRDTGKRVNMLPFLPTVTIKVEL